MIEIFLNVHVSGKIKVISLKYQNHFSFKDYFIFIKRLRYFSLLMSFTLVNVVSLNYQSSFSAWKIHLKALNQFKVVLYYWLIGLKLTRIFRTIQNKLRFLKKKKKFLVQMKCLSFHILSKMSTLLYLNKLMSLNKKIFWVPTEQKSLNISKKHLS